MKIWILNLFLLMANFPIAAQQQQDSLLLGKHLQEQLALLQNEDYQAWSEQGNLKKVMEIISPISLTNEEIDLSIVYQHFLLQLEKTHRLKMFLDLHKPIIHSDTNFFSWQNLIIIDLCYTSSENPTRSNEELIAFDYEGKLLLEDTLSHKKYHVSFNNCMKVNNQFYGLDLEQVKVSSQNIHPCTDENNLTISAIEEDAPLIIADTFWAKTANQNFLFLFEKLTETEETYYILRINTDNENFHSYNLLLSHDGLYTIILEENAGFISLKMGSEMNKATWFENDGTVKYHLNLYPEK